MKTAEELSTKYASSDFENAPPGLMCPIRYYAFLAGYAAAQSQLEQENARLREALESIASKNKPRHDSEEYWRKISHESCAAVLAEDTRIAREALAKIREVLD